MKTIILQYGIPIIKVRQCQDCLNFIMGIPILVRHLLYNVGLLGLYPKKVNPLRAKFFRGNINIYLHFISLLHIDMAQVLKILSQARPGLAYST